MLKEIGSHSGMKMYKMYREPSRLLRKKGQSRRETIVVIPERAYDKFAERLEEMNARVKASFAPLIARAESQALRAMAVCPPDSPVREESEKLLEICTRIENS